MCEKFRAAVRNKTDDCAPRDTAFCFLRKEPNDALIRRCTADITSCRKAHDVEDGVGKHGLAVSDCVEER
jgi:hypothetical protein